MPVSCELLEKLKILSFEKLCLSCWSGVLHDWLDERLDERLDWVQLSLYFYLLEFGLDFGLGTGLTQNSI